MCLTATLEKGVDTKKCSQGLPCAVSNVNFPIKNYIEIFHVVYKEYVPSYY